jgi:hypothetical protein
MFVCLFVIYLFIFIFFAESLPQLTKPNRDWTRGAECLWNHVNAAPRRTAIRVIVTGVIVMGIGKETRTETGKGNATEEIGNIGIETGTEAIEEEIDIENVRGTEVSVNAIARDELLHFAAGMHL